MRSRRRCRESCGYIACAKGSVSIVSLLIGSMPTRASAALIMGTSKRSMLWPMMVSLPMNLMNFVSASWSSGAFLRSLSVMPVMSVILKVRGWCGLMKVLNLRAGDP